MLPRRGTPGKDGDPNDVPHRFRRAGRRRTCRPTPTPAKTTASRRQRSTRLEGETVEGEFVILAGTPRTRSAPTMEDPAREGDPGSTNTGGENQNPEEQQPLMIGGHTPLPKDDREDPEAEEASTITTVTTGTTGWFRGVIQDHTSQRQKDERWTPTTRPLRGNGSTGSQRWGIPPDASTTTLGTRDYQTSRAERTTSATH